MSKDWRGLVSHCWVISSDIWNLLHAAIWQPKLSELHLSWLFFVPSSGECDVQPDGLPKAWTSLMSLQGLSWDSAEHRRVRIFHIEQKEVTSLQLRGTLWCLRRTIRLRLWATPDWSYAVMWLSETYLTIWDSLIVCVWPGGAPLPPVDSCGSGQSLNYDKKNSSHTLKKCFYPMI